jgi:hypothetical protein
MTTVIENGFPLIWVNQLARFETWNKHNYRPSNYIHKWWARRPGTVFRAILLGIFGNDSLQELYYRGQGSIRWFMTHSWGRGRQSSKPIGWDAKR